MRPVLRPKTGSWTGSGRPSPSSSASSCSVCATAPLSHSSRSAPFPPPSPQYLHYTQAVPIVTHDVPTCPIPSQALSHHHMLSSTKSYAVLTPLSPCPSVLYCNHIVQVSLICLDAPPSCHPPYPYTVSNTRRTLFLLLIPTPHLVLTRSLCCPYNVPLAIAISHPKTPLPARPVISLFYSHSRCMTPQDWGLPCLGVQDGGE